MSLWILVLLLLLGAAAPTATLAQDQEKQRADTAINEGRYGEALSILQTQITDVTQDAELFLLRARAFEGREEYQRAIADYERVLQLQAGNAAATAGLQRVRSRYQQPRGDLDNMRRLVQSNPESIKFRLQFADALYEAGMYREAAEHYEVYLGMTQGTPDILRRYLISIASYEGDNARGERVAEEYLRYYPSDDDLHMRLGYFRLWQGEYSQARDAFEAALRLNPNNEEAERGLQQAQRPATAERQGEQAPAQEAFAVDRLARELERNPNNDDKRYDLARELIENKRYWEAYEQLKVLAPRHDTSERWLDLFQQVDRGLVATTGSSPLYPVDRLTYLLRAEPSDADLRYQLVDALIQAGRFEEASTVLTQQPHARPQDDRFKVRLQAIEIERERLSRQRLTTLRARIEANPNDWSAVAELGTVLLQSGNVDEAVHLLARAVEQSPTRTDLRMSYARALYSAGRYDDAMQQALRLLERDANNDEFQQLHAMAAIGAGKVDERASGYLDRMLESDAPDLGILLDLADLRLAQGQGRDADRILRRAATLADGRYDARIESISRRIEAELIREEERRQMEILNDARGLAAARLYQEAIARYEEYFEVRGKRSRAELRELAQVHSAAGDFLSALSIMEALQNQLDEYDVAKEVAKNRFYAEDYAGAIRDLENLVKRNPSDFEVRLLLGDAYRQIERYAQARAVYQDALASAPNTEIVEDRIRTLEVSSVTGVAQRERGGDYVGHVVPLGEAVLARGSGTSFNRWSQGLMTQVTLPISAVLTAGITSHFLSGSRRLLPNSETVHERINQVYGGGFINLTPPLPRARPNYTNRISILGGLFDYEGGRTVPFGEIRYWHQNPDLYMGSVGVRSTEGALELWSPAGGQFALRLTQFDVRGNSVSMMPDSTLKLNGVFAYNIVSDNFGNIGTEGGANQGVSLSLEGAYKVLDFTFLGLRYEHLGYRNTVDIYFSPRQYETYTGFLEYEREYLDRWYFRIRGSLGVVARSNGFVARRLESELIYRLASKFTVNMTAGAGQSTRSLGNQSLTVDDRYSTFVLGLSAFWTL